MDGKPRQRVLFHLGRYTTVELALEGWPKEVEGLRRFASERRDKADRLKKEDAAERMATTILERVRKAEKLADEVAVKLYLATHRSR